MKLRKFAAGRYAKPCVKNWVQNWSKKETRNGALEAFSGATLNSPPPGVIEFVHISPWRHDTTRRKFIQIQNVSGGGIFHRKTALFVVEISPISRFGFKFLRRISTLIESILNGSLIKSRDGISSYRFAIRCHALGAGVYNVQGNVIADAWGVNFISARNLCDVRTLAHSSA